MSSPLLRIALTGGIASGKSHCLARFSELGVPVIDADTIAHAAVAPGTPGLTAVLKRFGPMVLAADGTIQVTNRTITALEAVLGPDALKGFDISFGNMKLLPKSRPSILDAVISVRAAEIKA